MFLVLSSISDQFYCFFVCLGGIPQHAMEVEACCNELVA